MNHRITSLVLQKRNRRRVNVFLDGQYAFGLSRILAAWLSVGQELSDEKIAQLKEEDAREVAYQQALKFLASRPRSEAEVRQNLKKHAITEENIAFVLGKLKENGLVDDQFFSQTWVENRTEMRPRSRRALTYELRRLGIEPELIERSLEGIDDEKLAYQAALKYARKLKTMEKKDFRQKLYRHLAQRGFDYEVIAGTIEPVWSEIYPLLPTDRKDDDEERS